VHKKNKSRRKGTVAHAAVAARILKDISGKGREKPRSSILAVVFKGRGGCFDATKKKIRLTKVGSLREKEGMSSGEEEGTWGWKGLPRSETEGKFLKERQKEDLSVAESECRRIIRNRRSCRGLPGGTTVREPRSEKPHIVWSPIMACNDMCRDVP